MVTITGEGGLIQHKRNKKRLLSIYYLFSCANIWVCPPVQKQLRNFNPSGLDSVVERRPAELRTKVKLKSDLLPRLGCSRKVDLRKRQFDYYPIEKHVANKERATY